MNQLAQVERKVTASTFRQPAGRTSNHVPRTIEEVGSGHAHQHPGFIVNEFLPPQIGDELSSLAMLIAVVFDGESEVRPREI
jgi:hypothetical protein